MGGVETDQILTRGCNVVPQSRATPRSECDDVILGSSLDKPGIFLLTLLSRLFFLDSGLLFLFFFF